ncbi:hypothetical protein Tco_0712933 [Tanacetum coccineum]
MTCSTVKRFTKPLDEPERGFQRLRRAALRSHQNESLAIAERNLFDDEASSSNNTRPKLPTPPKTLHKHSHPTSFGLRNEDPLRHIKNYLCIVDNIQDDGATRDTSRLRFFHFSLTGKVAEWLDRIPLTQITTYDQLNNPSEQGEDSPEWIIRSKFKDELANFMLEKKSHAKGIGDMLVQHRKKLREQYSQILSTINKSETPKPEAPTFAITTRSGISIQDPPFPAPPRSATNNFTKGETKREGLKKQKKDDEDERLLSIFKQIHNNLPFLEAMIHMPKGAKVLKDILSHKEKLNKATSLVKLSEECSTIIQRDLPQKEGDPRSFTLPRLIGPLAVKNALADLGANINLMPHSLF